MIYFIKLNTNKILKAHFILKQIMMMKLNQKSLSVIHQNVHVDV